MPPLIPDKVAATVAVADVVAVAVVTANAVAVVVAVAVGFMCIISCNQCYTRLLLQLHTCSFRYCGDISCHSCRCFNWCCGPQLAVDVRVVNAMTSLVTLLNLLCPPHPTPYVSKPFGFTTRILFFSPLSNQIRARRGQQIFHSEREENSRANFFFAMAKNASAAQTTYFKKPLS